MHIFHKWDWGKPYTQEIHHLAEFSGRHYATSYEPRQEGCCTSCGKVTTRKVRKRWF
jgi:hypothetical protein